MVLIASNELKPIWTDEYQKNDQDDASITATNCNRGVGGYYQQMYLMC